MCEDFKEYVILIMQHPIMNHPIKELSNEQKSSAYDLLMNLIDLSIDDGYTRLDYMQMARLYFAIGELAYLLGDYQDLNRYFLTAYRYLQIGGVDLSVRKWAELVNVTSEQ